MAYKVQKAIKKNLREKFEEVANGYLLELCNMWELDSQYGFWVSDEIGGVWCYEAIDLFISFDNMRYCITNDVKYETYRDWIDYCIFAHEYNQTVPNLESWCMGCPRLSESERQHLIDLKSDLENAIQDYKKGNNGF